MANDEENVGSVCACERHRQSGSNEATEAWSRKPVESCKLKYRWETAVERRSCPVANKQDACCGQVAQYNKTVGKAGETGRVPRVWYNNLEERKMIAYRFTRVIFGSAPSPYILGATLENHLSQYTKRFPETVEALLKNTYVDDVQFGSHKEEDLLKFKAEATQILQEGGFDLHKWHSNVPEAEVPTPEKNVSTSVEEDSTTYAKTEVGTKSCETKILGIPWNKKNDELTISLSRCAETGNDGVLTKRKMLSVINGVFDPLGLASAVIITAKLLYSQVCKEKLAWDEEIKSKVAALWKNWIKKLIKRPSLSVSRSVIQGKVAYITLHGFADASKMAVAACVYVVAYYNDQEPSQHLLTAKARVAPEKSIPRLELIAAHTLSKLVACVKKALEDYQIEEIHGWVDSTTVLHWLKGKGTWRQFVRNRVKAINDSDIEEWHYVPTGENPSDLGSRGVEPTQMESFWFHGPQWLSSKEDWPVQPEIGESKETEAEKLPKKERLMLAKEEKVVTNAVKDLLEKHTLWKTLRITALVLRFVTNCRRQEKQTGMLTAEEIESAEMFWIREVQQAKEIRPDVPLKKDPLGIWRCHGRVPDYNPIFLPRSNTYVERLIEQCHRRMLHGGVSVTMSCIRERFWVPKLRTLVKKVIHNCDKCKRFRVQGLAAPSNSQLPKLEEALLDIECVMNNRPLSYQGEEFETPVITPNILIRGQPAHMLQEDLHKIGDEETLPKRMVFLAKSKEQLRKRWLGEYLYALEERKLKQNGSHVEIPNNGKVVLLKEDTKNRAQWRIGRVAGKIIGRDGVVRGLKIKLGNGYIVERPLQLICDLEVGGENCAVDVQLNPKAQEFRPRESLPRKARNDAKNQMAAVKIHEDQEDLEDGY
eukprot:gene8342-14309_t